MKLVEVNAVNTELSREFDFGIHAASCADLKRGENRHAQQYTHEAESPQALVDALIEDLAGDFGEDAESFAIRVFPCCGS
jgi:hypothetical protein